VVKVFRKKHRYSILKSIIEFSFNFKSKNIFLIKFKGRLSTFYTKKYLNQDSSAFFSEND